MTGIEISANDWLGLLTHVKQWLGNLVRAGKERKTESKEALRSVVLAVRETEIYVRHLNEDGKKSIKTERALSLQWTNLSFRLEDIKLNKLAKRCRLKDMYWADPAKFSSEFLDKAGTKLSDIEKLALLALREIDD